MAEPCTPITQAMIDAGLRVAEEAGGAFRTSHETYSTPERREYRESARRIEADDLMRRIIAAVLDAMDEDIQEELRALEREVWGNP